MVTDPYAIWIAKTLRHGFKGAFRRDDARNLLRRTLESAVERHGFRIHAWAALPARVELVLTLPPGLSVQDVVGDTFCYYTRRFNARYGRSGPMFRSKFLKRVLASEESLRRTIREVNLAPVRAGLERKTGQEPFSSAGSYADGESDGLTTVYPGMLDAPVWQNAV